MYLELSRPAGDVSRWEKVLKRLTLLNKHYPLKPEINCAKISNKKTEEKEIKEDIFIILKNNFIEQEVVFFGGYATYLYSRYMPEHIKIKANKVPEFDVLSEQPNKCALIIKDKLINAGIKNVEIIEHDSIEDIIPKHFEIQINKKSYAYIYEPIACHNYNIIDINKEKVRVATIDTMLSFYLAFIYTNNKHYNKDRILCLAKYLFEVEQHNRLEQNGILKRFSTKCYGEQHGLLSIRAEKTKMFKLLANKKGTKEYETWFLKYVPGQLSKKEINIKKKKYKKYIDIDSDIAKKRIKNVQNELDEPSNKNIKYEKDHYIEHKNILLDTDLKDVEKKKYHIMRDTEKKQTKFSKFKRNKKNKSKKNKNFFNGIF
jgi:hypothetical protein